MSLTPGTIIAPGFVIDSLIGQWPAYLKRVTQGLAAAHTTAMSHVRKSPAHLLQHEPALSQKLACYILDR